jgi:predicted Zn-dependent protease
VSKRLLYLEKVTSEGSQDPMAWYALAMEYRTLGRTDEAWQTFMALRKANPQYLPMFLMCGQLLAGMGRGEEAREWLEAGIAAARTQNNAHTLGELESALTELE